MSGIKCARCNRGHTTVIRLHELSSWFVCQGCKDDFKFDNPTTKDVDGFVKDGKEEKESENMMTTTQYAMLAGVSSETVRRWCESGTIKATKNGNSWAIDQNTPIPEKKPAAKQPKRAQRRKSPPSGLPMTDVSKLDKQRRDLIKQRLRAIKESQK